MSKNTRNEPTSKSGSSKASSNLGAAIVKVYSQAEVDELLRKQQDNLLAQRKQTMQGPGIPSPELKGRIADPQPQLNGLVHHYSTLTADVAREVNTLTDLVDRFNQGTNNENKKDGIPVSYPTAHSVLAQFDQLNKHLSEIVEAVRKVNEKLSSIV